jgi:hypothetical protein
MTKHFKFAATDTPYRVSPAGVHSGVDITIQNLSSTNEYIYVGGENVSTFNFGYRLSPGHAISFELPGTDSLYVVSGGTVEASVIMTNLESGQ